MLIKVKQNVMRALCSLVFLCSALFATACSGPELKSFSETRTIMGTFTTITLYANDESIASEAFNAAFARMKEIEQSASILDESAEAYLLNAQGQINNPSLDLKTLVELSVEYGALTNGYFDITIQPLLELWEGGLWAETPQIQQERVDETMAFVGYDKIILNSNSIILLKGMEITLGGIAKGYAAGEALTTLIDMGIKHAIVNAGGDIATLGSKADGTAWKVTLVNPDDSTQLIATFALEGASIATSGNYARYFDPNGKVSHIINPWTGYSSVSDCISVTIITLKPELADALATAVFVMGPVDGMRFVESLDDVECMIIGNDRQIHRSSGLDKYEVQDETK